MIRGRSSRSSAILVEHPRCPFCHDAIGPADEATPCLTCRAWQHSDCASEGRGRCGACRAIADRQPVRVTVSRREVARAARAQAWSIALWVAAWSAILVTHGTILPAFETMFREVGVSLPPITVWTLGAGKWSWAGVILTLLHAGALTRDAVWRDRCYAAAVAAIVGGAALGVVGLFAPLCEIGQKL